MCWLVSIADVGVCVLASCLQPFRFRSQVVRGAALRPGYPPQPILELRRRPMSSSMASPGKRSAAATRVPAPKNTGNQALDTEADLRRTMLQDIIDECLANPQHIMHLHGALLKRQRSSNADHGEVCFATISTLCRLPQEFAISYLTSHSDMSAAAVVEAVRHDSEAIGQLVVRPAALRQLAPQRALDQLLLSAHLERPIGDDVFEAAEVQGERRYWPIGAR